MKGSPDEDRGFFIYGFTINPQAGRLWLFVIHKNK
jgi:hypothetical protein